MPFKRKLLTIVGSPSRMDYVNFSKTSLPPILRITSSGDAPVRVDHATVPAEARKTIRLIEVEPAPIKTALIPPPEAGGKMKLRRRRHRK